MNIWRYSQLRKFNLPPFNEANTIFAMRAIFNLHTSSSHTPREVRHDSASYRIWARSRVLDQRNWRHLFFKSQPGSPCILPHGTCHLCRHVISPCVSQVTIWLLWPSKERLVWCRESHLLACAENYRIMLSACYEGLRMTWVTASISPNGFVLPCLPPASSVLSMSVLIRSRFWQRYLLQLTAMFSQLVPQVYRPLQMSFFKEKHVVLHISHPHGATDPDHFSIVLSFAKHRNTAHWSVYNSPLQPEMLSMSWYSAAHYELQVIW
jgi:hypothetical protein